MYEALLTRIAPLDIVYLHVLINPDAPAFGAVRGLWFGPLMLNTGRDTETSFCHLEQLAEWGVISAAAVGRSFLAKPDLIDRLRLGAELNEPDVATFYAPGPVGYVDYRHSRNAFVSNRPDEARAQGHGAGRPPNQRVGRG